ncbi:hypothetical protein [Halarcobacter anaerophilus]|uniref:Uncharacterized protein n=1 Tax=Halarcobacter anaerophilus TaxID=877500 RepID=A0A4Q0Y0Q1_9BACT|nr:hypothetical protein [Halarcobacter anaerophilus]QDF28985.1 hypothetical protein AANAER_1505 [Halarcobacter anaerophilus]RXJ63620.1 hypothetical protein CRV06_05350 [Halarcobacter anaerophilus]
MAGEQPNQNQPDPATTSTPNNTTPPENNQGADENLDIATIEDGIRKDEARLTIMQEQFTTATDKINDEFESTLASNPNSLFSDEELEKLASDSNIVEKNKMLRNRFEKFRDEKLTAKREEIGNFEKQLQGRRGQFDILSESNKFSKENPDVDMEALAEYIQEDLSPRKKKELRDQAKTKFDFLTLANEEFKKANPPENEEDKNLPPDLSGVNGASGNNSYSDDIDREKYLKSIGIGR